MALTRDGLMDFLQDELGLDISEIHDDTPLFSSGLIDSFSLVSLIGHVERAGGIRMSPMDVNLDNMDTVQRILRFLERMKVTA